MNGMLTQDQKAQIRDALLKAVEIIDAMPARQSCASCDRFKDGWCSEWSAEVPEEVQESGCEKWFVIPF